MTGKNDAPPGEHLIEEERIPLVEERLVADRVLREGRTVTVSTRPVARDTIIREPVLRETVSVERVPVGAVVADLPPIREDGDLTVIPVVEERVRVVRELVLVEEVHLHRTRHEELHEETVTTLRTEVEVSEDTAR
ncbi:DUF2382 domain-containing protein [Porphyrobacter sp. GA68]|uniref:DUF2382 domain-containing protein n=1 Tax=Porphyrobacter sp. GA68 TaxID=2883480 RepID=UPI001D192841|nr:DUF2382 domain-containing protein [Porphyrobacter sp. GA68]